MLFIIFISIISSQKIDIINPTDSILQFKDGINFNVGNIGHVPYG